MEEISKKTICLLVIFGLLLYNGIRMGGDASIDADRDTISPSYPERKQ